MPATDEVMTLIPLRRVSASLDCSDRTTKRLLAEHQIPIYRLGRSKVAVKVVDYVRLLNECRQDEVA